MSTKRIATIAAFVLITGALAGGGAGATTDHALAGGASFTTTIDNVFFPLPVGGSFLYRGVRDGTSQVDRVSVTDRTRVVDGVTVVVVRDVAKHGSTLLEKTFDWYAQEVSTGAVWYFGENTKTFDEQGHVVSTEGSWEAGVDGAVAGIIMEGDPTVPDGYRQEFYAGHAEDAAWVLSLDNSITVPYGRLHHVLRTMEWTPLEPEVVDQKYYAPGIGLVDEVAVAGDDEFAELVSFTSP
jgi:hypothetical protein